MSSARESQGHHGLKRAASPDVNGRGAWGSRAAGGGEEEAAAGREAAAGPRYAARAPRRDAGKAAAFLAAPSWRWGPSGGGSAGGGGTGEAVAGGGGAARGPPGPPRRRGRVGAVSVCSRRAPAAGRRRTSATRRGSRSSCGWWALGRWGRPAPPPFPLSGHTGTRAGGTPRSHAPAPSGCAGFSICDARNFPRRGFAAGRGALWGKRQHSKGNLALGLSLKEEFGFHSRSCYVRVTQTVKSLLCSFFSTPPTFTLSDH